MLFKLSDKSGKFIEYKTICLKGTEYEGDYLINQVVKSSLGNKFVYTWNRDSYKYEPICITCRESWFNNKYYFTLDEIVSTERMAQFKANANAKPKSVYDGYISGTLSGYTATAYIGNDGGSVRTIVTQPISGTVVASYGTTSGLALDHDLNRLGNGTSASVGATVRTSAPTYTTGNINPLSLTTAGALRVDGSGTTQPVSGTVTTNGTTNFSTFTLASTSSAHRFTRGVVATSQVSGTIASNPTAVNAIETVTAGNANSDISTTVTGCLSAVNQTVGINMIQQRIVGVFLSGNFNGTVVAELSLDGGLTWQPTSFSDVTTGSVTTSLLFVNTTSNCYKIINVIGGSSDVRVRVSSYTSGSLTCAMTKNHTRTVSGTITSG